MTKNTNSQLITVLLAFLAVSGCGRGDSLTPGAGAEDRDGAAEQPSPAAVRGRSMGPPAAEKPPMPDGAPPEVAHFDAAVLVPEPGSLDGGLDVSADSGSVGNVMCSAPRLGCQARLPRGATCDPVCQSGCECDQRCGIGGDHVACLPSSNGMKKLGDSCSQTNSVDDCSAGNICLDEFEPVCGKHCFRFCNVDAQCANGAHCTTPLTGGQRDLDVKVCDNPPDPCSPIFGKGACSQADRPLPAFGCYVMGTGFPDEAVCDCAGDIPENGLCQSERECKPGLVCIAESSGNATLCKRVCPLDQPTLAKTICGPTKACAALARSTRFGYCR